MTTTISDEQLTDWYPKGTKPYRIGVYKTNRGFQYWNGKWWGAWGNKVDIANVNYDFKSMEQKPRWRGLKEQS